MKKDIAEKIKKKFIDNKINEAERLLESHREK